MTDQTARDFFRWVAGYADDDLHLLVWTLPDKKSRFFKGDLDAAAAYAVKRAADSDVYFGCGLLNKPPAKGRGTFGDISAIGGVWADIDVAGPAHKKGNLPATEADAHKILDRIGLPPSVVIHSGHGLQAYWLLDEIVAFESPEDRNEAATLTRRWVGTVRAVAHTLGYDLDSVGDITRVFRVPGTYNRKVPSEVAPVRILTPTGGTDPVRYSVEDFEQWQTAEELNPEETGNAVAPVAAVGLSANAQPPMGKVQAMRDNLPEFAKSMDRQRSDLPDQSPSSYDMSLATLAVNAGWEDQEITDLLIYCRVQNKENPKLRRDYYQRTIGKARADNAATQALTDMVADAPLRHRGKPGDADSGERAATFKALSQALGVDIIGWVQHGRENARYSLVLADGRRVRIGTSKDVLSTSAFTCKLYEATGKIMPTIKRGKWMRVAERLASVAEVVENDDASLDKQVADWLTQYLDERTVHHGDEWAAALTNTDPFVRDGRLGIHVGSFAVYIRNNLYERIDGKVELMAALHTLGFRQKNVSGRPYKGDSPKTRSYFIADASDDAIAAMLPKPDAHAS